MTTILPGYEPFANATLSVDLAMPPITPDTDGNTGWVLDPVSGNTVPAATTVGEAESPIYKLTYRCHLHAARNPALKREVGVNSTTFPLEGQLLSPWKFDELIVPNQVFNAQYNNLHGTFELLPQQDVMPEFLSLLGTRLVGTFRLSGPGSPSPIED